MKIFSSNTLDIPKDLQPITDARREHPAEAGGMSEQQLQRIITAVEDLYRTGNHPQISFCLRRQGKILINRSIGYARGNFADASLQQDITTQQIAAKTTTPICLFSASKLITAMLVHILDEAGEINLLDPISYYIPEYAQRGKRYTTIFHLLSHRGGIPRLEGKVDPEILFDQEEILKRLYAAKPMSASGSKLAYHALTAGYILGEIIERVTQKNLKDYLQEKIASPMEMRCFNYGVAPEFRDEVALNYVTGFYSRFGTDQYLSHVLGADLKTAVQVTNDPRFMDSISPAANIYTSAEEICRFFEMLLNGGEYQGHRIMTSETVFRATLPTSGIKLDHSLLVPMRYALGPMLGNNPVGLYGPMTGQAFGHLGFSNNICWADPQRDISVALLSTGKSVVGTHLPALMKLLYQISTQCPKVERSKRRAIFGTDPKQTEII
ncbi:serine hydrolase domain-containing protein [Acinetobacter populi]|uniref:Serine hydrolase n=1 Tax=Acinetobacter populi TaxID=1582270 RepID=A0A1Z9YZI6_9GAMM|nr:serine hydrolase domain-containing protein [Acinetobacter populi]OUY07620.1 serine hydrolase [Acinetobacter populi]